MTQTITDEEERILNDLITERWVKPKWRQYKGEMLNWIKQLLSEKDAEIKELQSKYDYLSTQNKVLDMEYEKLQSKLKKLIPKSEIKDTIFLCTRGNTGDINKERFEKELKL